MEATTVGDGTLTLADGCATKASSPKKTVKLAVIGAGWWGATAHIPALKQHALAELVAIQSRDVEKARRLARHFGVAYAGATVDEILGLSGIDGVIISSTPNVHYVQARAALERGLHTLVEKPMTLKASESKELVALAEKKGLHFLISCPWHYTSHTLEARRLIQSGVLGQTKMISVLMTNFVLGLYQGLPWSEIFGSNPTPENSAQPHCTPALSSYCDPVVAGGGQIYSQISHVAAHLGMLTGRDPVSVFAQFDNAGTAVDVYNTLNLKLEDGTLVSVASTGATPHIERNYELRIYGTKGFLSMELWKGKMEYHLFSGESKRYPDLPESQIYPMFAPAENFVDVILGRAENGSPARLGHYAMRIIEGACESARTGNKVTL